MGNPTDQSPAVLENKPAILCHWLLAILLALAFGLQIASFFLPLRLVGQSQLDAALIMTAALSTLASLWRRLPLQNVLTVAFGIAVIGGGLTALGAKTGLPFGPFIFGSGVGPVYYKSLSWVMPLIWVVIILNSRGVARLILRPWRKNKSYGYRVIGLTALLVLLFDVALDPFASRVKHGWVWMPSTLKLTWQGAPLANFLTWAAVTLLILVVVTPWLIVKKPRQKRGADFYPAGIWFGGLVIFAVGCGVNGIWAPVVANAVIGIGVIIFAIRGVMW
jgi:uncharacterized membrane protein